MKKSTLIAALFCLSVGMFLCACGHKASKVEIMRQEKAQKDSLEYIQTCSTLAYSDSVLQTLLPEVEPLMQNFRYEKNESYEDHGHYVSRLLQTGNNTQRCFIQAYLSDQGETTIQSYYYGARHINQQSIQFSVEDVYISAEGRNHAFDIEGAHEILSVIGKDAIQLLQFISVNQEQRIKVTAQGTDKAVYYLTKEEKQALADTYTLAVLMNQINELERAIKVCNKRIEKRQKKLDQAAKAQEEK